MDALIRLAFMRNISDLHLDLLIDYIDQNDTYVMDALIRITLMRKISDLHLHLETRKGDG